MWKVDEVIAEWQKMERKGGLAVKSDQPTVRRNKVVDGEDGF
jgi:hypothetical protein